MAYLNDEDDEALMLALKASIEEQDLENPARKAAFKKSRAKKQDLENPARKNSAETRELEGLQPSESENESDSDSDSENDYDEEETLPDVNATTTTTDTTDDDITKALENSLLDYKKNEEETLHDVMTASLDTIEEDRKRKLKKQSEEDEILSKVIEESYASNVAAQFNSGLVIGGSINQNSDYDYTYEDEAEYMRVVLQQIKESEEKEAKMKLTKNKRSIIQEQDFEYEEALKQDIAKEKAKTKETKIKSPKNTKPRQSKKTNNNTIENIINSIEEKDDTDEAEDEQLKTVDDIRKARLAFFERK